MENVTDTVFRRIVATCGSPDVFFTEFTRVEQVAAFPRRGLPGRMRSTDIERPLVVQIWGTSPELYLRSARIIADLGFAGIDINMGCPVRKIRNKGSCSGLISRPALAAEIIAATREGAVSTDGRRLPVSVKTRIGIERPVVDEWVGFLLAQGIDVLTVHGRTALQESEGPCDYDTIARAVQLRNDIAPDTLVFANGDIRTRAEGSAVCTQTGCDGAMIGRGIFSDPYLFAAGRSPQDGQEPNRSFSEQSAAEKVALMTRHIHLHRDEWKGTRNYEVMKRFYKIYLVGFPGAEELRDRLNHTYDYEHALREIADFPVPG